jgi:hypothetical protein
MTILNLTHKPDEVLFVCDSEATARGGELKRGTKLWSITHANVMLAGTGDFHVILSLYGGAVMEACDGPSFDNLAERLPQITRAVARWTFPRSRLKTCVILAGWSESRRRMACIEYDGTRRFAAREIDEATWIAPTFPELSDVYADTMQELVSVARRQRPLAKEAYGQSFAAGADLVCARLTRDRMSVWQEPAPEAVDAGKAPSVVIGF